MYFFQQTKTKVAIFEDLDRFKDPHIFETLRELNTVLNNSEQVSARPLRFVYAVRDSIFEQLEVAAVPGESSTTATGGLRAAAQESAPSANRTKFFDLVVPMVPFITHRSARDLLTAEFADSPQKPSAELIALVTGAGALTDMRLIRNIRNEFEIYRASVLSDNGLGLTADRLLAMMVYKNTHLEDFEAIRLGTSLIDSAHRAFRKMVEHQVGFQLAHSRKALAQARGVLAWGRRAATAGERLQRVLPIIHKANPHYGYGQPSLVHSSVTYAMTDLTSGKLWKALFETRSQIQLGVPGYHMTTLTFEELLTMVGDKALAMESAVETDVAELRRISRVALETKEFVTKATMAQLMARTDLTMPASDLEQSTLDEIVSSTVSPLARGLLAKGYIDENFTLYCSDYHGVAISVSAMNFILHCVQADRTDPLFLFDDPASIEAVESEMGDRFLAGESVFNVAVFNHYLAKYSERLNNALDRLATRATAGDTSFIDLYLVEGATEAKSRLVSELAPRWLGLFVHLVDATEQTELTVALVDAAIRNAERGEPYESSSSLTNFIEEHYTTMTAFTGPIEQGKADELAYLLRGLSAQVSSLSELGQTQRLVVVAAGLYPVTRANLRVAIGGDAPLALDVLRVHDKCVYEHAVSNLYDYLNALNCLEVTIEDPSAFLQVLSDIVDEPEHLVRSVAERASVRCEVGDLGDVTEALWPAVVPAGRFRTSVTNVSRFVAAQGVTPELAERLATHELHDVEKMDKEAMSMSTRLGPTGTA